MHRIAPAIVVALLVSPAPAAEQEVRYAPDYSGMLTISYQPVMCVRAPCPPGQYLIEGEDFAARARTVIVERNGETVQYTGQHLDFKKFIGGVWVGGETGVDVSGTPLPDKVISIQIIPQYAVGR